MKLGDFFSSAATARPVNPKVVKFTAISRDKVLPGGAANTAEQTAAEITAALCFIGGEGISESRVEAREALVKRFPDRVIDDGDRNIEATYQCLYRILREWDPAEQKVGGALFPSVDLLRKLVAPVAAEHLMEQYNKYVEDEHPEVIGTATFRKPKE